ncbi:MAG: hypothetical protein Q7T36_12850 [Fluviicoccus sp.]|uniref:hypothetical protein n=1 Tax=Fluviicoccus sp. TaxID=2003552 RepID=UPI0027201805|nr:hypothetical protein [Fluviicoccus sp.]MDO8331345.1 hypothetical protein [Fluviicoccus sp.]
MKFICPDCQTTNQICTDTHVSCGKCHALLSDKTYGPLAQNNGSVTGYIVTAIIAITGTLYTVKHIEDTDQIVASASHPSLSYRRFPMPIEYELVKTCVEGARKTLTISEYRHKQTVCLCIIDRATKALTFHEYIQSPPKFAQAFREQQASCLETIK